MGKTGEESPDVRESALKKAKRDFDLPAEEDLEEGEDFFVDEGGGKGEDLLAEEDEDFCVYGDEVVEDEDDEDDEDDEEEEEEEDASLSEEEDVDEEFLRYYKQRLDSDGFDVYPVPERDYYVIGLVYPIDPANQNDAGYLPMLGDCACKAVEHYNKFRHGNLEFVEVLKGTRAPAAGDFFYITFKAKDLSSGDIRIYQTKVYDHFEGRKIVKFFRTKPENLEARK